MNVLLLSMPDCFEYMPPVVRRMPNSALTSLAGTIDTPHGVAVAYLTLSHGLVRETIIGLIGEFNPESSGSQQ